MSAHSARGGTAGDADEPDQTQRQGAVRVDLTTCTAHHVHAGRVVRCELGVGHAVPHATQVGLGGVGRTPELVTWDHDMGRRAAEAEALRRRRAQKGGRG